MAEVNCPQNVLFGKSGADNACLLGKMGYLPQALDYRKSDSSRGQGCRAAIATATLAPCLGCCEGASRVARLCPGMEGRL